jgi:hypothetical protein
VSLILGTDVAGAGVGVGSSPAMPDTGGLVARGDGTAAGKPKVLRATPRLNPRFGRFGVPGTTAGVPGGATDPGGVEGPGVLNSAQRGHLRFVSVRSNN